MEAKPNSSFKMLIFIRTLDLIKSFEVALTQIMLLIINNFRLKLEMSLYNFVQEVPQISAYTIHKLLFCVTQGNPLGPWTHLTLSLFAGWNWRCHDSVQKSPKIPQYKSW